MTMIAIPIEFLGWDRPLLHATVDYLIEHFTQDGRLDLRRVVLTLPGRRAINRLEEMLAEQVETLADLGQLDSAWYPPEFLTLGTLPERFYEQNKPIADDLTQRFAWMQVFDKLEDENPDLLEKFLPHPPKRSDLEARLILGKIFATLHRELAADAIDFSNVTKICKELHLEHEADRWAALAIAQQKYIDTLFSLDIWDLQTARLFAINNQKEEEYDRIVQTLKENNTRFLLVGLVDMNQAQKKILSKFSRFVTPLVFAPKSLCDRFDSFGCLKPDAWAEAEIAINSERLRVVEKPTDQADAVLREIAALQGRFAASEIVIGVPDTRVIPYLEQRLDQAEIETRHFQGTPLTQTGVYRFCEAVLGFLDVPTFHAFAEIMRHPDVERYLSKNIEHSNFLTELDQYHSEFLPWTIGKEWLTLTNEEYPQYSQSFDSLQELWLQFKNLLGFDPLDTPILEAKEHPSHWMKFVENLLDQLYPHASEDKKDTRTIVEARKRVRNAASLLTEVPETLLPKMTLSQAIKVLLLLLQTENIPPHEKPDAIEMLGWLEIVMDDAAVAIVTGMNEGIVPSFLTADMFLPDKVRQHLGLEDNKRRYARDAYSLSAILQTRHEEPSGVTLIAGRRSAEGDPLLPSRLFFATDEQTVAERVRQFFGPISEGTPFQLVGSVHPGCARDSHFRAPELASVESLPGGGLKSMRVTEFADYQKCPYRYYLKHRLRLEPLDDTGEELDGGAFGNLVHDILKLFGLSDLIDSMEPMAIQDFLTVHLNEQVRERYGSRPRAAIAIQAERALERLKAFAPLQADWRKKGYRILHVEFPFNEQSADGNVYLSVDDDQMFLRGRIDRIDVHEQTDELVVLDYKTSNSAADPEKTHRRKTVEGVEQWIDFQLPLYHYILRRAGYTQSKLLGYVTLPKDLSKTGFKLAEWSAIEIQSAVTQAEDIVRCIRRDEFPMVVPPPKYSEVYSAICLDNVLK